MRHSESLYTLAVADQHRTAGDRIATAIAEEALDDAEWRALYDAVLDSGTGHPETMPSVITMSGYEEYGAHLLDVLTSPLEAVSALHARADELGFAVNSDIDRFDLVTAAVGLELWRAAIGADDLCKAASMGPCSVRSLAAVLARSIGEPVANPMRSGQVDTRFASSQLRQAVTRSADWAFLHAGPDHIAAVLAQASRDLVYRADAVCTTAFASASLAAVNPGV